MQTENKTKIDNVTATVFSKIKPSYSCQELYQKNKELPIDDNTLKSYIYAVLLSNQNPFSKYQKFYEIDLSIDDMLRLGHKLTNITSIPNYLSTTEPTNVQFTDNNLIFEVYGEYIEVSLLLSNIKPKHIALAAIKLLNSMGFMVWDDTQLLYWIQDELDNHDYQIDEDCDNEIFKLKRDYLYWINSKTTKEFQNMTITDALTTVKTALHNNKLTSEFRLWLGMILFLFKQDFNILEMSPFFNNDNEGIHPAEIFCIHLRKDSIYSRLNDQRFNRYSYPFPFHYQLIYEYDKYNRCCSIVNDNTHWINIRPHEIVENIFNYGNWFFLPSNKKHKNVNLNSIESCFRIIQSYFDIQTGNDKFDLHRDFECYKRKVIRLQKLKY